MEEIRRGGENVTLMLHTHLAESMSFGVHPNL